MVGTEKNKLGTRELDFKKATRERKEKIHILRMHLLCAQCFPYAGQSTNVTLCQAPCWAEDRGEKKRVPGPNYSELTVNSRH